MKQDRSAWNRIHSHQALIPLPSIDSLFIIVSLFSFGDGIEAHGTHDVIFAAVGDGFLFFAFFYTAITFDAEEIADNMKRYGGFIPGIRAGNATSRYLTYVMNRLNTVGAVYLLFVALIPTVLIMALGLNAKLPFGGTTILIIAGVGLDTLRQAKAQTEQFQYTGFLFENVDHKEG